MLQPRIRAVGAVLAKLDPLLAEGAEDAVGLDLANERVGAEGGRALLGVAPAGLVGGLEVCWVEVALGGRRGGGRRGRGRGVWEGVARRWVCGWVQGRAGRGGLGWHARGLAGQWTLCRGGFWGGLLVRVRWRHAVARGTRKRV
jgi:hypothetical protein